MARLRNQNGSSGTEMAVAKAIVRPGYGVASGSSADNQQFPGGTIRMQKPFFKERGLDFDLFFDGKVFYGTLNLSIAPRTFRLLEPGYHFENVEWTKAIPPEDFYLSPAEVHFRGSAYKALIYIPDPATKTQHHQGSSVIEVIAQPIVALSYGDEVSLVYSPRAIAIE